MTDGIAQKTCTPCRGGVAPVHREALGPTTGAATVSPIIQMEIAANTSTNKHPERCLILDRPIGNEDLQQLQLAEFLLIPILGGSIMVLQ